MPGKGKSKSIALTGGIASGKSTAARIFQALGAVVLDADEAARAVVAPQSPVLAQVAAALGPEALLPNGQMNRAWVGAKVFAEPEARAQLNAIMHPAVRAWMGDRQREALASSPPVIIQMIPLLFEGGLEPQFEESWLLDLSENTQLERLMQRDGFSLEAAQARVAAQMPLAAKRAKATRVLNNQGNPAQLAVACARVWAEAGLAQAWPVGAGPRPEWMGPELMGLLAWNRACHEPVLPDGSSNPLPMTLMARAELGASPVDLLGFAEGFAARLAPRQEALLPTVAIESGLRQGGLAILRSALAPLAVALAQRPFDGLIRLAYGLKAQDLGEVAAALAQLEASGTPPATESQALLAPETGMEALAALLATAQSRHLLASQATAQDPSTTLLHFALLTHAHLEPCAGLELLIAVEAYGRVRPYLSQPEAADQAMAKALLRTYAAHGAPRLESHLERLAPLDSLDWASLLQKALVSTDDRLPMLLVALRHIESSAGIPGDLLVRLATRAILPGHAPGPQSFESESGKAGS